MSLPTEPMTAPICGYGWNSRHHACHSQQVEPQAPFSFDKKSYKLRHRIENAFCRLKDFRRIAARYNRLARSFLASICPVAAVVMALMSLDPSFRQPRGRTKVTSAGALWPCPRVREHASGDVTPSDLQGSIPSRSREAGRVRSA